MTFYLVVPVYAQDVYAKVIVLGLKGYFFQFHFYRLSEEPQSWMGYFGKALMTPASYLPSQVTEVFTQGRAFATVKLPHAGTFMFWNIRQNTKEKFCLSKNAA